MSDYSKCKWCGSSFKKSGFNKFLAHNTAGLAGKESYCSEKCKNEAENGGSAQGASSASEAQNTATLEAKEAEINAQKEIRVESKIDSIAQVQFGESTDAVSEALNQLATLGSSKPEKAIRKAIVEKMEFGIMKLQNAGKTSEVAFFEKKMKKIKPKWYD